MAPREPRLPGRIGAWTLFAWAAVTIVWWPLTRLFADAHGFHVTFLIVVDVAFVVYAAATMAIVLVHLRGRKPLRRLAWLTVPPLAFAALRGRKTLEAFALDLSGYPADLAVLHWVGNLALLALLASVLLLLVPEAPQDPAPAAT